MPLLDWDKPHVLEHVHDKLPDTLLIVDPPDHSDTDLGDPGIVGKLKENVLQDLDYTLADRNPSVLEMVKSSIIAPLNSNIHCLSFDFILSLGTRLECQHQLKVLE